MRNIGVSTHSRPKAAGCTRAASIGRIFRFNTQPPEGGWDCNNFDSLSGGSFNTQPPEGGWPRWSRLRCFLILFQHTAARRRLELFSFLINTGKFSFNTQPPEGGWDCRIWFVASDTWFQHTAARRRLVPMLY